MSFWKVCLCLALLAVSLSEQKPVQQNVDQPEEHFELLRVVPHNIDKLLPKELLKQFVDTLKANGDATTIVNDKVEEFLSFLNYYLIMNGHDPVRVSDQGFEFEFKWLLITYSAEMTLKNGWAQGLGTLIRKGDCTLEKDDKGTILKLVLSFEALMANYEYTAKIMGIGPKGGVDIEVRDSQFTITVRIDSDTGKAYLESYKLNKQGKMTVRFTGIPLTDFIANILAKGLTTFMWPLVRIFVSSTVQTGITVIIEVYNESISGAMSILY